jgi:lysyl-tRNA synthetase class 1
MSLIRELGEQTRAWPFEEARSIIKRIGGASIDNTPKKGYVLFETGYGPSGLPHIGTFGEVARTTMVRNAFSILSDIPTRLIAFSDDLDGLRKVPENISNKEMLQPHIGKPLTSVPDPFGTHDSFGSHNNARLKAFLDKFKFDYDFYSSTKCYRDGLFDETLLQVLYYYNDVMEVILPTLGKERQATYSPFLPICPRTGVVLQVSIHEVNPESGKIIYLDPGTNTLTEVSVTGGHCKLQWKADWAMRWSALEVDYEMSGKDLIDSVRLSGKISRILGTRPPEGLTYELFLDENAEKISKSRGNGLTIDQWLSYGPPESLSQYMYNKPKTAKRLYFDVIPKSVDEYLNNIVKYNTQEPEERLRNGVWHIHGGEVPDIEIDISFAVLLNLASACNTDDPEVLWGFIGRYAAGATPLSNPFLDRLVIHALSFYRDFVKPKKSCRVPDDKERAAMMDLIARLELLDENPDAETIQTEVYAAGKEHEFDSLRDWFKALYEVLFGDTQGPRFGSFVALYGVQETVVLIKNALEEKGPRPS